MTTLYMSFTIPDSPPRIVTHPVYLTPGFGARLLDAYWTQTWVDAVSCRLADTPAEAEAIERVRTGQTHSVAVFDLPTFRF